jgi:Flp pilus assembly protein TadG
VSRRDETGSAVVEFALVLPLLLLVALALVQVTVVGRDRLLLQHAARAGAREAAVDADDAAVRQAVLDAAVPLDPAGVSVTVERAGGFGQPVLVRVAFDVPVAMPLAGWLLPASVHLAAQTAMRQEFG